MNAFLLRFAPFRGARLVSILSTVVFLLLTAYGIWLRTQTPLWPSPFQFGSLLMAVAMTSFALCASVAIEMGARSAAAEDIEPAVRWVAIAISCWLVFLFLEIVEWVRLLYLEEYGPGTIFGRAHFLVSGFHWLAVIASVGWMTWTVVDVRQRRPLASALFAHTINLWWLVIVVVMYFSNATLSGF